MSVLPPNRLIMPVLKAANKSGEGPPENPFIALLYATIAFALLVTRCVFKSASANSFNFSRGLFPGSASNIFEITAPTEPIIAPAANTASAAPTPAMPLATFSKFSPSMSANDFSPSANVGNALPKIHAAPAIPAPIATIAPPSIAAPSKIWGFANAFKPAASPFNIPPIPVPRPFPIFPIASPKPLPACDGFTRPAPANGLAACETGPAPPPNIFPILLVKLSLNFPDRLPIPLAIAPNAALPTNNAVIAATRPNVAAEPVNNAVTAPNMSPDFIFSTNDDIEFAIAETVLANTVIPLTTRSNIPLSINAFCNAALAFRIDVSKFAIALVEAAVFSCSVLAASKSLLSASLSNTCRPSTVFT